MDSKDNWICLCTLDQDDLYFLQPWTNSLRENGYTVLETHGTRGLIRALDNRDVKMVVVYEPGLYLVNTIYTAKIQFNNQTPIIYVYTVIQPKRLRGLNKVTVEGPQITLEELLGKVKWYLQPDNSNET